MYSFVDMKLAFVDGTPVIVVTGVTMEQIASNKELRDMMADTVRDMLKKAKQYGLDGKVGLDGEKVDGG